MHISTASTLSKVVPLSLLCLGLAACNNSPSSDKQIPNQAPFVQAITAPATFERETLSISASAEDKDGSIQSYQWQQLTGTAITPVSENGADYSFILPEVQQDETLTFRLTVTDNNNAATSISFSVPVLAYTNLESVEFKDQALLDCLQTQQKDLGATEIVCDRYPITSTDGLHRFQRLTQLSITNARLTDISNLSSFTHLSKLNLSSNQLPNVAMAAITSMKQLKELDLSHNKITRFDDYFRFLPSLEKIRLINPGSHEFYWQTSELDLASINNIEQLRELHLRNVYLGSQTELKKLSAITQLTLAATGESLTDVSFLSQQPQLKYLDLEFNTQLQDIAVLESLTSLEYLDISYSEVSKLETLRNLTQLQTLKLRQSIDSNPFDLSLLAPLKALSHLDLSGNNNLQNLESLSNQAMLTVLKLQQSKLDNVSFLAPLKALEQLNLSANANLSDISALASLTQLKELDISNNPELIDLSALANLPELLDLKAIDLKGEFGSQIQLDLAPLGKLAKLQKLDISFNPGLQNITSLNDLTQLTHLTMANNHISQFPTLDKLSKLQQLDLSTNSFSTLPDLTPNQALQVLTLNNSQQLTSLSGIQQLPNLQALSLRDVRNLSELGAISQLTSLKSFTLSYNPHLQSAQTFVDLNQLETLVLQDMPSLADISALQNINSLKTLNLQSSPKIPCSQQTELTNNRPDIEFTASSVCAR